MPAPFLIDLKSISQSQIKNDLVTWALNLPNQEFKPFFEDEAGEIIITLVSGLAAYNTYNDIVAALENSLFYVQNKSSAVAITTSYAYNPFRGRNSHVQIRFTPNKNFNLTKFTLAGFINGIPVSPVIDYTLIQGQPITVELVIGEIEETTFIFPDNKLNVIRFSDSKVSHDTKLELNNTEVAISNNIIDLLKDYWYVQTNTLGGVDSFYLNESLINPLTPYNTGDELKLTYIKLGNIIYNFPLDLTLLYGIVDEEHADTKILTNFLSPESKESIQINGPLYNETARVIKAREDSAKTFKTLFSAFIDTNSRDVNLPVIYLSIKRNIPAFADVTYIKSDLSLLTIQERNALLLQLNGPGMNGHGIPNKEIFDPKRIDLRLNLILTQKPGKDNSTYVTDIQNIFDFYLDDRGLQQRRAKKLQFTFNLKDLEHDLERLAYVTIARATIFTRTYAINTLFKRGEFLLPSTPNGKMFEIISETYDLNKINVGVLSSGTEPVWDLNNGAFTYEGINTWQPDTVYALNTLVKSTVNNNLLFRVHKRVNLFKSGLIEPVWGGIINELIEDNDLIWQVVNPYEVTNKLIYKTHDLLATEFTTDWNEYFILNYGFGVTWL